MASYNMTNTNILPSLVRPLRTNLKAMFKHGVHDFSHSKGWFDHAGFHIKNWRRKISIKALTKQSRLVTQHGKLQLERIMFTSLFIWISFKRAANYKISRIMDFSILNSLEWIVMVTSLGKSKENSFLKIIKKRFLFVKIPCLQCVPAHYTY